MARPDETDSALTLARYRRLILLGRASLPLETARRIVGPDCAYHLYFRNASHTGVGETSPRRATRPRRPRRRPK